MGDAYTPGLTVTGRTRIRKTRRLPLQGRVMVEVGARVRAGDVVARTELPGKVTLLNFANLLGVLPDEIEPALRVRAGDAIRCGQLLAEHRAFFGLSRSRIASPIDGTFESVSAVTGQAVLRDLPRAVELDAYVDGTVIEVLGSEGVVIETEAALIQGIFGLGGEVHAPLALVGSARDAVLDAGDLSSAHAGAIVVGGGQVTLAAMRRARDLEVAAVVAGGFAYHDVRELLGYDVGVAVTGGEDIGTTLILTEGFGGIAMAESTYELLARHAGRPASASGATQIRAGVIRPEVIITEPIDPDRDRAGAADGAAPDSGAGGLDVGAPVRCIRAPHFGRIGVVAALPVELVEMPSETRVRVVEVDLEGSGRVVVPRANVEVIVR
jgi:hypothetical protein